MVYELKITLQDVGVPVSRTLLIEKDATFAQLHETIQSAFDWTNSHLFTFFVHVSDGQAVERVSITEKSDDFFGRTNQSTVDYEEALLSDWFKQPQDKIMYVYDFGDDWMHDIVLLEEEEAMDQVTYPVCIAAENYAPPEDSRFELTEGKLDLVARDSKQVLSEVNQNMRFNESSLGDFFDEGLADRNLEDDDNERLFDSAGLNNIKKMHDVQYSEEWEKTLAQTKEFLQKKPWEVLGEQDIFVVKEPKYNKLLFCRVAGDSGEKFGLEIYFGWEGFFALLAMLSGEELKLDGLQHERALFVTFEDRTDLEKVDYNLIKAHSPTFRGKKSWPEFTSFLPGFFPWEMDEEEAVFTRIAMGEVLLVMEECAAGLELPHIVDEEKILLREMDKELLDETIFESLIVDVEELIDEEEEEQLVLSELELKRLSKIKTTSPVEIEFTIIPLEMPSQEEEGDRPFFPFLSLAVDASSGEVYYHNISESHIDLYSSQQAFLRAMDAIGGVPSEVATDPVTARSILPFLDIFDFGFSIEEELDKTGDVLEGLMEFMLDGLSEE